MKKIVIILTLLAVTPSVFAQEAADKNLTATEVSASQVNYEKPYYNQPTTPQNRQVKYAEKNSAVYKKSSGNDYILKYNIDDLESAPWLNGGKRKY